MVLTTIIFSTILARKVRTALTLVAIAAAVSLVVAVTTGYKSAEGAMFKYLSSYLGATDVQVVNGADWRKGMDEGVVARVRRDPDVAAAYPRLETDTGLLDKEGKYLKTTPAELVGVERPGDDDVGRIQITDGAWFDTATGDVAVVDQKAAEVLKVKVGDTFLLPGPGGKRTLKVVGICHKPGFFAERLMTIYLPLRTAQDLVGRPGKVSRVMIRLRSASLDEAFARRWEPELKKIDAGLSLKTARESRKQMDKQLEGVRFISMLAGAVALLTAAFIIFSTLSMGVAERQRTLAMMRAIGASKGQIARLVLGEAAVLGAAGAAGGVPLGILWSLVLTRWKDEFFGAGMVLDWPGVALGVGGSVAAALLAGLLPAWNAARVSPLEAMTPLARIPSARSAAVCALLGLALAAVDPFFIFFPGLSREARLYGHVVAGVACMLLGFFLMAPLAVWAVDWAMSRLAARMMRLPPGLLRQQLSGGVWRAAGTGAALMVGLGILVIMQTVGNSVMAAWRLPTRFPDIFIWTANAGLPSDQWGRLEQVKGVKKGKVMPMVIGLPGLPKGFLSLAGAALIPDATMFVGMDPDLSMEMMELEFREGTPAGAVAGLKKGRHVIITEEMRVLKNLHVGDKLPLMTRNGLREFTICGVVWSPGIDVMVSMFDLRGQIEQRTAMTVFGSLEDARNEFGWDEAYLFAANLETGTDREELIKKIKEQLGEFGWKAGDVRHIKKHIVEGFEKILGVLTFVAFSAMAVAALGVTNTVMASVRSRVWQFGVLRSIGVTRGQLLRLVMAEAVLLGAVGCVLGLGIGVVLSNNGLGLYRSVIGFVTPMVLPWGAIAEGVAVVFGVSLLASLWPATSVATAQPLDLLQAGRAAI